MSFSISLADNVLRLLASSPSLLAGERAPMAVLEEENGGEGVPWPVSCGRVAMAGELRRRPHGLGTGKPAAAHRLGAASSGGGPSLGRREIRRRPHGWCPAPWPRPPGQRAVAASHGLRIGELRRRPPRRGELPTSSPLLHGLELLEILMWPSGALLCHDRAARARI